MTDSTRQRGAALVGTVSSLSPWEAEVVHSLRLWCAGPARHIEFWNRMVKSIGPTRAREQMVAFDQLVHTLSSNAHRPLVRKQITCRCICADEAMFLHLVSTASEGDLHEAAAVAALMVPAAHAEHVALMAANVGEVMHAVLDGASERAIRAHRAEARTDNVVQLH